MAMAAQSMERVEEAVIGGLVDHGGHAPVA